MTHFEMRAAQRIGVDNPEALAEDLRKAFRDPERWSDYVEFVMQDDKGRNIWRFRVQQGIFYTIEIGGRPVTVFTQGQMRGKKFARRNGYRFAWSEACKTARGVAV